MENIPEYHLHTIAIVTLIQQFLISLVLLQASGYDVF
jgi:hypothetical protein